MQSFKVSESAAAAWSICNMTGFTSSSFEFQLENDVEIQTFIIVYLFVRKSYIELFETG
jgi:hypothetical protein